MPDIGSVSGAISTCYTPGSKSDLFGLVIDAFLMAVSVWIALENANRVLKIAEKEFSKAKKYYDLAVLWRDHYVNNFAPVEDHEVAEATDLTLEEPIYSVAQGRARVGAAYHMRDMYHKAVKNINSYSFGLRTDRIANIALAQSDTLAVSEGLGYRNERGYIEARDDVRFHKRINVMRRGRDIVADNVSFINAAAGIYGDIGDQAMQGLMGAGQFIGYTLNRMATRYPVRSLFSGGSSGGASGYVSDMGDPDNARVPMGVMY